MKQAIILESKGLAGGACESVRLLIQNLGHKTDLIVPALNADYNTKRMLKSFYGDNVGSVYEFNLPYSVEYTEGIENYDIEIIKMQYYLLKKKKKDLYSFLEKQKYDHIHLNGFGLYPVLNKKFPMTLHVRQDFCGNLLHKWKVSKYLKQAKALIFIDTATQFPFIGMNINNIVLPNPVDQTKVNSIRTDDVYNDMGIDKKDIVFTVAGNLSELKGQEFLINVFNSFNKYPYKLLIAGDGEEECRKKYTYLAKDNKNILFLGQINREQMYKVYSITDYVIRAEAFFGVGRTALEGLYSGCGLVIQGSQKELKQVIGNEFINNSYSYVPRNKASLIDVLTKINGKKILNKNAVSTACEYGKEFNSYINKILN